VAFDRKLRQMDNVGFPSGTLKIRLLSLCFNKMLNNYFPHIKKAPKGSFKKLLKTRERQRVIFSGKTNG